MKKLLLLSIFALLAALTISAQKNSIPSNVQKDIDAIKKMETDINAGFVKGNADANDKYVSENARFTAPDGMRLSRDGISMAIRNGSLKFTQSNIIDLHVMVFIDTAIATYDSDDKGSFNGMKIDGKARWTDTWARINGNWICVASAGTNIVDMPTK
jgi:ketosteroid isomerase-like protein